MAQMQEIINTAFHQSSSPRPLISNTNPKPRRIQHHLHHPCTPSAPQTNNQNYRRAHTTSIHQHTDSSQSTQDPLQSQKKNTRLNQNIVILVSGIQAYYHRELYLDYLQHQQSITCPLRSHPAIQSSIERTRRHFPSSPHLELLPVHMSSYQCLCLCLSCAFPWNTLSFFLL